MSWRPEEPGEEEPAAVDSLGEEVPGVDNPGRPPGEDNSGAKGEVREPRASPRACGSSTRGLHSGLLARRGLIPSPRRTTEASLATTPRRTPGSRTAVPPAGGWGLEGVPRHAAGEHSGVAKGAWHDLPCALEREREALDGTLVRPDPPGPSASGAAPGRIPCVARRVVGVPAGSSGRGRVSSHNARTGWRRRRRSRGSSDKPEPSEFSRAWGHVRPDVDRPDGGRLGRGRAAPRRLSIYGFVRRPSNSVTRRPAASTEIFRGLEKIPEVTRDAGHRSSPGGSPETPGTTTGP